MVYVAHSPTDVKVKNELFEYEIAPGNRIGSLTVPIESFC